jgi:hypothetical protein
LIRAPFPSCTKSLILKGRWISRTRLRVGFCRDQRTARFGAAIVGSDLPKQHKSDSDDQDGPDNADTPVAVAVTVAAKTPTKAAEQKNNEDDNEDDPYRHALISGCMTVRVLSPAVHPMLPQEKMGNSLCPLHADDCAERLRCRKGNGPIEKLNYARMSNFDQ